MIDPALIPFHALWRKFAHPQQHLRPSCYYQCTPANALTADGALGWNTVRAMPFVVPNRVTLTKIGAEVVTAGAAGAVFRLGIWEDTGNTFPGQLALDAGTIAADGATGPAELTISKALKPGLYWVGGAIQGGTSGTQPVIRALSGVTTHRTIMNNGFAMPVASALVAPGFAHTGVNGAFGTWTGTNSPTGACVRAFVKIAA